MTASQWGGFAGEAAKGFVAGALCALLVAGPLLAQEPVARQTGVRSAQKLTEDQKALHALNRFTFGARPGDVQGVEAMGLRAWFERQLNPQKIDDTKLDAILMRYPAMQLSQQALLERFPPPQVLRRMEKSGTPLPSDPAERAIYANGIANYAKKLAGAEEAKAAQATGGEGEALTPAMDGTGAVAMDAGSMSVGAAAKIRKRGPRAEYAGEDAAAILALPPDARMAKILAMTPDQSDAFRRGLSGRERVQLAAGLSPAQTEVLIALSGPVRVVAGEALATRLLRDVYSDRQLEAVMTDFWLNHFSVYVRKNQNEPYLLPSYERDTIRPRALGKFEDLLVATAKSPAMLMYLDNWQSIGPDSPAARRGKRFSEMAPNSPLAQRMPKGINENYARELIELHTYGVQCEVSMDHPASKLAPSCGAGYTQADVTNVAKVLTGWTIDRPYAGGGGGYTFEENRHEGGAKRVLGVTIEPGGEREGLEVLHKLATSPATAHFIAHKLAVRFVSDDPPAALEDRMARTFVTTGGDIKAVLRTLFDAPEFWTPAVYRAKVKTPLEFVVSALRATDATVANPMPLVQAMDRLGMPLYGMQTPNGYAWNAEPWVSTTALVSRMNFALVMSGGLLPGTRADWPRLLGEAATGSEGMPSPKTEMKLETLILGQPAAERTRAAVLQQAAEPGQAQQAQKSFALSAPDSGAVDTMLFAGGKGKGKRGYAGAGASMTDLASSSGNDGPVSTMAGLLLGSPDFQRR